MTRVEVRHGEYLFTVYGGGIAATLTKGGSSIHWQGDDANEVADQWAASGPDIFAVLWDIYADLIEDGITSE